MKDKIDLTEEYPEEYWEDYAECDGSCEGCDCVDHAEGDAEADEE